MPSRYKPGIWARKYRQLGTRERDTVNQLTNEVFRQRTSVMRKLDPKRDRELCWQWLRFRDEVMEQRSRPGFLGLPSSKHVFRGVAAGVDMLGDVVADIVRSGETPWMDVAYGELKKGVAEKEGKAAHSQIMEYSRTCPHLYATENKTKYMNSKGDEGFKWCSAFVNWCFQQVGITGTKNALAMSWLKWGKPIPKPQYGAVVIIKTSSWNHVAFVDDTGKKLRMLGGNQKPEHGDGPDCVSYQKIYSNQVVGYRIPS